MKKSKTKNYEILRTFVDSTKKRHTIFVYAEVTESYPKETIATIKCIGNEYGDITLTNTTENPTVVKHRMRSFNMGYAICQSPDIFDHATAVKIAKSRFTRVPMTAINARYLNDDMAKAIVTNEADYILANFNKFANDYVLISEEIPDGTTDNTQETKETKEPEKPVLKEGDIAKYENLTYCAIKKILGDGKYILYWVYQTNSDGTYNRFYSTDEPHYCPSLVKCTADEARNVVNALKRNFSVRWSLNTKDNS